MGKLRVAISSAVLCAVMSAGIARAQNQAPSSAAAPADQVEALMREGNDLAQERRLPEAEAKYQAAAALSRTYITVGNVGLMQGEQGKWRDAAQNLWMAMNLFPPEGKPIHLERLQQMFNMARAEVAAIAIKTNVKGAQVSVDGVPIDVSGQPEQTWFVEPGKHTVQAVLASYQDARETVHVAKGGSHTLMLNFSPVRTVAEPGPKALQASGERSAAPEFSLVKPPVRTILIGAGAGTAAVLAGIGTGFAVAARGKEAEADDLLASLEKDRGAAPCLKVQTGCEELLNLRKDRDRYANTALWTFIAGGTIGAGTLVYTLVTRKKPESSAVQVLPTVGATGTGVWLRGRW